MAPPVPTCVFSGIWALGGLVPALTALNAATRSVWTLVSSIRTATLPAPTPRLPTVGAPSAVELTFESLLGLIVGLATFTRLMRVVPGRIKALVVKPWASCWPLIAVAMRVAIVAGEGFPAVEIGMAVGSMVVPVV